MNPKIVTIQQRSDDCVLLKATVKGVASQSIVIDSGDGVVNAQRAFSCLVAPAAGDCVLINSAGGHYHVLAVLERPGVQDTTLSFAGDVCVDAQDGELDLRARRDIHLSSAQATHLTSTNLNLTSASMNILCDKVGARLGDLDGHARNLRLFSDSISTMAKQVTHRAEVLVRRVEKVEILNIGNLVQNIRKNFTSHSKQAVITASKDMRIDGERIHMG